MDENAFRLYYGATWLNFVATLTGRLRAEPFDRLTSPERLAEWFAAVGLAPQAAPTDSDVAAAVELREALYEMSRAAVEARGPVGAAVRVVSLALTHDAPPTLRSAKGELVASAPATATDALGRVARQAAEQVAGPDRARLRACAEPTCAGVYVDETGRRRWCADASCGVRSRVRAHRARAKL